MEITGTVLEICLYAVLSIIIVWFVVASTLDGRKMLNKKKLNTNYMEGKNATDIELAIKVLEATKGSNSPGILLREVYDVIQELKKRKKI